MPTQQPVRRSILIIGAGIAGLSAGCYGQMNGYDTRILEMHNLPGGVCTSWQRQGYTLDGCIGWLVGSAPGVGYYDIWRELGALQGRRIVNHDEFLRVETSLGQPFILYSDIDRLEEHMRELAPNDVAAVTEIIAAAQACARFNPSVKKAPELLGLWDNLKFLIRQAPFLGVYNKWKDTTLQDMADRFTSSVMREALPIAFDSALGLVMTLGWLHRRTAGYPIGGSLPFAQAIARRYLDLGGQIGYRSRVTEILVEQRADGPDRAVGVRLADGSEHRADIVISAADGHATLFDMLGGRYLSKTLRTAYDEFELFPPLTYLTFGVNRSFEGLPHRVVYPLDPPVSIGGVPQKSLSVEIYHFDPTLAPEGKTVVKVMCASDYHHWAALHENPAAYRAAKDEAADTVLSLMEPHYPGITEQIEVRDVATPLTWERYTGNWKGAYEGWRMSKRTIPPFRFPKTLPGLEGFYMAGQWVEPGGGLPAVAVSGRNVIQIVCKGDGRRFDTTRPVGQD